MSIVSMKWKIVTILALILLTLASVYSYKFLKKQQVLVVKLSNIDSDVKKINTQIELMASQLNKNIELIASQLNKNIDNSLNISSLVEITKNQAEATNKQKELIDSKLDNNLFPVLIKTSENTIKRARFSKAKIRDLPYPFYNYLSIASDADSMTWENAKNLRKQITELKLSLSDSAFLTNVSKENSQPSENVVTANSNNSKSFLQFLNWYNKGWFDTIHGGWDSVHHFYAKDTPEIVLDKDSQKKEVILSNLSEAKTNSLKKAFFLFQYIKPLGGSLSLTFIDENGQEIETFSSALSQDDKNFIDIPFCTMPRTVTIDISHVIGKLTFDGENKDIKLNIFFTPLQDDDTISMYNANIVNNPPSELEKVLPKLDEFNIKLPVYTHHGYPLCGKHGMEHYYGAPERFKYREWIVGLSGDNPASLHYSMKHLDKFKISYVLPADRTSQNAENGVLHIKNLVRPFLFNDGKQRYSFERFSIFDVKDSSLESTISILISGALSLMKKEGEGAIIYTHWGLNPKLCEKTITALQELAERFYGWNTKTKDYWSLDKRVWIAPLSKILEYSRMIQGARDNVQYDPVANIVFVSRWVDPITGETYPSFNHPLKQLDGLTIYVKDSHETKLFIDDKEYTSFKRNPKDLNGQESITLIDDTPFEIIFDDVDFYHQGGKLITSDVDYYFRKSEAHHGKNFFEIVLRKKKGVLQWSPDDLDSSDATHLRFSFKKSNPSMKIKLRITLNNNMFQEITETGTVKKLNYGYTFENMNHSEWADRIIDFVDVKVDPDSNTFNIPRGRIKTIEFIVSGNPGDTVSFDNVTFLRPDPIDRIPNGAKVGGIVNFTGKTDLSGIDVFMRLDGKEITAKTDANGVFFFDQKVPENSIVSIWALGKGNVKIFPKKGRLIQVNTNIANLEINMSDDPRPKDLMGQSKYPPRFSKGESEFIPKVGARLKPHSLYVTTGLSDPVEFAQEIEVNNLGYLDKAHRIENLDKARRIFLISPCTHYGHTEDISLHPESFLEAELETRMNNKFEVFNFGSAHQVFGTHKLYYDVFGKKMNPEIVIIEIVGLEVIAPGVPEFLAARDLLDVDHLNIPLFSLKDGKLSFKDFDINYLDYKNNNPESLKKREDEKKKDPSLVDGFDGQLSWHRDINIPLDPLGQKVWDHFAATVKLYNEQLKKDHVKLLIVINDIFEPFMPLKKLGYDHNSENFRKRLETLFESLGVSYVYLNDLKKSRYPDLILGQWRRDSHPNRIGYQWYANMIADYLIDTNFLEISPKKP